MTPVAFVWVWLRRRSLCCCEREDLNASRTFDVLERGAVNNGSETLAIGVERGQRFHAQKELDLGCLFHLICSFVFASLLQEPHPRSDWGAIMFSSCISIEARTLHEPWASAPHQHRVQLSKSDQIPFDRYLLQFEWWPCSTMATLPWHENEFVFFWLYTCAVIYDVAVCCAEFIAMQYNFIPWHWIINLSNIGIDSLVDHWNEGSSEVFDVTLRWRGRQLRTKSCNSVLDSHQNRNKTPSFWDSLSRYKRYTAVLTQSILFHMYANGCDRI